MLFSNLNCFSNSWYFSEVTPVLNSISIFLVMNITFLYFLGLISMPLILYQNTSLKGRKNVYIYEHGFIIFAFTYSNGKIKTMKKSIQGGIIKYGNSRSN